MPTKTMLVRLAPWAEERIVKAYSKNGKVSKAALRQSLKDMPDTEFRTIATPDQPRDGAVVTTREAHEAMYDVLEVRMNGDRDVAVITIHPSGGVIVS